MSAQKELLSPIFEPALSLDNNKPGSSRSLHLFERMAERLDEIAANTRGFVKGIVAHASSSSQGDTSDTQKEQKKAQKPIQATIKAKRPTRITNEKARPTASQKPILASVNSVSDKELATRERNVKLSGSTVGNVRSEKEEKSNKKATISNASAISQPRSAIANNEAKEKRNAEENGNRIAEAVLSGIGKFGNLLKSGADTASQNSDIKDAAGYAFGGPFYGALKEIKEALPDISSEKPDDEKERKADSRKLLKAINDPAGRQRDDKGRFIKPDQNAARRQIAQTEVAEAQLALDEKEAKKEEKRHKELLRAVKANKRGMLDRFLDRRMGLGRPGRDRIIRERTVHEKGKPGAKAVQAKGPKPDSRLLPNHGSNGRLSREAEIGSRARRKGILSRAGGVAQSAGKAVTGTLAMGSKALGGMLRMLPGIGQALALGMAAYEGFQGWNDKELHQQAFGLKEGQEATTGQKASSAAASILDMGGLTSGLLGMFGIEFDKAGIARSIYGLGSNIGQLASDVIAVGKPLLNSVWKGIKDFGDDVANFAGSICAKGIAFASDIGSWAENAIRDGTGIVTGIWNDAKTAVSGCWAKLSGFTEESISEGGKILSNLWNSAKELPGKIISGAADLAKGALETGGKLLSDGWNAVKNWGKGLFSSDEAEAKPVNQAEIKQTSTENTESPQIANNAVAHEVTAKSEQDATPETEIQATPIINPVLDSKLSSIDTEENAQKSATSSESASSALALEQMKQNGIENKSRDEIINNLELANKTIKNMSKLLEEEFRKDDLPDEFGIAGALQNVSSAIQAVRSGASSYSYGSPASGAGHGASYSRAASSATYAGLGDVVNMGETGGKGTAMISTGAGDHGGVSYGRSQLASRVGSIQAALKWARANGFEDIASQLEPLQGDASNRQGQFAQKWAQLAAEKGGRLEQFDRAYQKQGYYDPMMAKIRQASPELARRIDANPALQEQVLSTSVQYCMNSSRYLTAANEALGKNANMSDRELLVAIQDIKARDARVNFKSSSARVQESIANRHGNVEKQRLLAVQDRFERGEIKIDPQTGTAQVTPGAAQARLAEAVSQGGNEAVNAGMFQMVAAATQTAIDNDVKYKMGAKNSAAGQIDCSGWVSEMGQRTMAEMNKAMGAEVFSKEARQAFKNGANGGAAGIIKAVSDYNGGQLLTNEQLSPDQAREGMVIGLAKAGDSRVSDRFKGIGHIVQTYRDPQTGELMVSESRGGKGVMNSRYSDWYAQYQKKGYKMYGSDLSTMADASKIAPAAPKALADSQTSINSQPLANNYVTRVAKAQIAMPQKEEMNATKEISSVPQSAMPLGPVSHPVSLAQANNAAPVGIPTREPLEVPAIREIDPGREVKTLSSDNGPILKILGEILAAIQAGNKRMGHSQNNDGPPFISTEYDEPAAQGLAADTA